MSAEFTDVESGTRCWQPKLVVVDVDDLGQSRQDVTEEIGSDVGVAEHRRCRGGKDGKLAVVGHGSTVGRSAAAGLEETRHPWSSGRIGTSGRDASPNLLPCD